MSSKIIPVVVIYNPDSEVIKNIESYISFFKSIIVVDNSDTKSEINDEIKNKQKIIFIDANGNNGLGLALNLGTKKAKDLGYNYVMTMDQDSKIIREGFQDYLDIATNQKDCLAISPQYSIDRKKPIKLESKIKNVTWTMQSASIFNILILDKLGFFSEKMFLDCTDYEMCLRAKKNNFNILVNMNYSIIHNPGITRQTKILKYKYGYCSPLRIYYQRRNLLYLYSRYKNKKILLVQIIKLIKIVLFFDKKLLFLKMWSKGKKDYTNNLFGKYQGEL